MFSLLRTDNDTADCGLCAGYRETNEELQAAMLKAGPSGCGDQGDLVAGTEVITLTIYYKEL